MIEKEALVVEFLNNKEIFYERNVDLKKKTWIKRGGLAHFWIVPDSSDKLEELAVFLQNEAMAFEIVGSSSNCYFLNSYNPFIIVSSKRINRFELIDNQIVCGCGVNMVRLTKFCIAKGIGGFEGFINLPGTVGGAVINNAGCYGSLISNNLVSVSIVVNGQKKELSKLEMKYSHRNSYLKSHIERGIVTRVVFDASNYESSEWLKERSLKYESHRRLFQEQKHPNLGSTYCYLKFKKLSIPLWFIHALMQKTINAFFPNSPEKIAIRTRLFLFFRGVGYLRDYISDYGVQCFIWRDQEADRFFKEYIDFIEKNTTEARLEIEIKGL